MSQPPVLLELQGVHDNLRTIDRDLSDFPADLATLDRDLKANAKRTAEARKTVEEAQGKVRILERQLTEAASLEEHARKAVKAAGSKVQYTSAIRELDVRERATAGIRKPLGDLTALIARLEAELADLATRREGLQEQFDGLHAIFLSEHANQVTARGLLATRRQSLESALPAPDLVRFNRLLDARQGKAVALVDTGTCTGCRTRLRTPLMGELREKGCVLCESCQRFLVLPPQP